MNKIKIMIVVILFLIIILIISLFMIKDNSNKEALNKSPQDTGGMIDTSLKKQQSPNIYFSVEQYLNIFFSEISKKNNEEVYYLLHEDYVNRNNITIENVFNKLIEIPDFKNFNVIEMYVKEGENEYCNFVKGTMAYDNKIETWYGMMEINNNSFAVFPLEEKEYQEIILGKQEIERKSIKPNMYNEYFSINYDNEDLYRKYFEDYKTKALYNIDEAYNLLEYEYRKERFDDNIELFEEYMDEKKEQLEVATMVSYSVEYDGYNIKAITIKDDFDNYYIIKENTILDYTIQLDNYTIKTENFRQKYLKLSKEQKVVTNLDEFVRMINNKDYKHAYYKLYNEFKNNYFPSENDFKEYMNKSYYNYNVLSISSIVQNENDTYVCEATLRDGISNNADTKKMNVIMRLVNQEDYVLSFEIDE